MQMETPLQKLQKSLENKKLYPFIKQMEQNILTFVQGSDATYRTPPLDKKERWICHQLADLYILDHLVQGAEDKKEIILTKKSGSLKYALT
jgi:hypothetical protein